MQSRLLFLVCLLTAFFNEGCQKKPGFKSGDGQVSQVTGNDNVRIGPGNYNVLLIVVDDLRWWSVRGLWEQERIERKENNSQPITPNIDALMQESVTFSNAYAPGIACTPSRTSFMTGKYPVETGVYRVGNDWQSAITPQETLVWSFQQKGYAVSGAGKIFHDADNNTINQFWFNKPYLITQQEATLPASAFSGRSGNIPIDGYGWRSINNTAVPQTQDHLAVNFCIDQMQKAKQFNTNNPGAEKPFFIACGIRRPHAPLIVPDGDLDAQPSPVQPKRLPIPASFMDLTDEARDLKNGCSGNANADVIDNYPVEWAKYMKAYAGCVTYADKQIGRLINDGLKQNGFGNNTIVVLISDNGFHLGEKHHTHKNTFWEESLKVPMIWKLPGNGTNANKICRNPVDLMVVYKTLIAQLNLPTNHAINGRDITSYLTNPLSIDPTARARAHGAQWKPGTLPADRNIAYSGTVRTADWRLIQYAGTTSKEELYDEINEAWENTNKRATASQSLLTDLRTWIPNQPGFKPMIGTIRCD